MNRAPRTEHRAFAYSLIEVTIAIAVIAVGVVALVGTIPHGLFMMGNADETAAEARISQLIIGELMLADWDHLDAYDGERRYYDREGIALASTIRGGKPREEERTAYVATIEVLRPLGSIPAAETPAENEAATKPGNLKRVQVHVADVPLVDFEFKDARQYRTFATVVARMEQ